MRTYRTKVSFGVTLAIAVAVTASVAAADSASSTRRSSNSLVGGSSGGSSSGSSSGSSGGSSGGFASGGSSGSTNRSVSFNENGKKISITENNSGITITTTEMVDGKEKKTAVKAGNAEELEKNHPEAYRLYVQRLGGTLAMASGVAAASGGRSSHASGRQSGRASGRSGGRSGSSGGTNRSVSFSENGKSVTITESSDSGITVTTTEMIAGKEKKTVVKAANPEQLQKRNPEAYRLYKSHMDNAQGAAGVDQGGEAGPGDARGMLREQLREQVKQNAGNPQMKAMLEKMLRDLD